MERKSRSYCRHLLQHKSAYIIFFCIISLSTATFGPDSSTLAPSVNTTAATTISSNTDQSSSFTCRNLTNAIQRNMCFKTPGLLNAIRDAEQLAKQECEEQFKFAKWNCSGFAMTTPTNVTKQATAEAAYVYALMSAALAHVVTRDCRSNGMNCKCGENKTLNNVGNEVSHGCSNNLKYGVKIATEFMDGKEKHGIVIGDRQRINLQNNKVGRTVFYDVNNESGLNCKCIGVSASCSVKVCKVKVVSFNGIVAQLKKQYESSCKVSVRTSNLQPHCNIPVVTNTTLVHVVSSPDYCHKDVARGSVGVRGRFCNPLSNGQDNCNKICCGRGHEEHTVKITKNCCSPLPGCCKVECTVCVQTKTLYTCR